MTLRRQRSPVLDLILGRPLASSESNVERLGVTTAIPVLGLDALASAAYGPEALLTVLLPLGVGATSFIPWITLPIALLILIVWFSYRQTIAAYPEGAGAYTVAHENLGENAALLAAAALTLDYVLNSAVAISAGVGALVSAVPSLHQHTLLLCLSALILLTLVNLRGVRSTGVAFLIPSYGFILSLFLVLGVGLFRFFAEGGHPLPLAPPQRQSQVIEAASIWLFMRAFASGCTAMTGIEAVSNAVSAFREPSVPKARSTLLIIVGTLVILVVGIAFLCHTHRVTATPPGTEQYRSVLSQVIAAVVGHGAIYYVTIAFVITVLMLSANTSFADFPRLLQALARDGYTPEMLVHRGRRLTFSYGILVLAFFAALLLVAFQGVTDPLIPLFAVGALLAFTLSQSGMVAHWRGHPGPSARTGAIINALGAGATGLTLCIVLVAKFTSGAWISVVLVAVTGWLFRAVRKHHEFLRAALSTDEPLRELPERPVVVVPLRYWNAVSLKAMQFALCLGEPIVAVQVLTRDREVDDLAARWHALVEEPARQLGHRPPTLTRLDSDYRELHGPVVDFVKRLGNEFPTRQIAVVIPELVEARWFHFFVHGQSATMLKALLLLQGGPQVVVVSTPWYLRDWIPERARLKLWARFRRVPGAEKSAP